MDAKKVIAIVVLVGLVGYLAVTLNARAATHAPQPAAAMQRPRPPVAAAAGRASAEPRGKLPWSTGDVSLWDDD